MNEYATPAEQARRVWENGYIDMPTIRREFAQWGLTIVEEIERRVRSGVPLASRYQSELDRMRDELKAATE